MTKTNRDAFMATSYFPLPAVSITGTHGQHDRLIMVESADPRRNQL